MLHITQRFKGSLMKLIGILSKIFPCHDIKQNDNPNESYTKVLLTTAEMPIVDWADYIKADG